MAATEQLHTPDPETSFVVFEVGPKRLALDAGRVREVVRAVAVTPLPKAPPVVEGVINYRGTPVPVMAVRDRFGLPQRALDPSEHFVLADAASRLVALRVDRASELLSIPMSSIESAESVTTADHLVAGIVCLEDGILLIHDLDRFLTQREREALDATLEELIVEDPEP